MSSVPIDQLNTFLQGIDDPAQIWPTEPAPGVNIPGDDPTWTVAMLIDIRNRILNHESFVEIADAVKDVNGKSITLDDVKIVYDAAQARYLELIADPGEPII